MTTVLRHAEHLAPDPICAAAVDQAWQAAIEEGGDAGVGQHLETTALADAAVAHTFACLLPGYVGWQWQVVLSRARRSRRVTVSEVSIMPATGALVAPEWVSWSERVEAGDLTPGTVLGTEADDIRLAPGWSGEDGLEDELDPGPLHPVNWEAGLGRRRVPSELGRSAAASRWYAGDAGPKNPETRNSPGRCGGCGWMLLIGGPLGQEFGVCSNVLAPRDGQIVSHEHGCGGFSEAEVSPTTPTVDLVLDEVKIAEEEPF